MSLVISKEIGEFFAGHSAYLSGSYRRYDDETVAAEYSESNAYGEHHRKQAGQRT